MSLWFRMYAEAMRNPKVARLSDKDFRLWVRLLAVASENDGIIPPLDDLKHLLNTRLDYLSTGVKALLKGGLIDELASGYEPHNWGKFQFKSDTSTDRVNKFRQKRNVSVTPPEPETEPYKEVATSVATARAKNPAKFSMPEDWRPEPLKSPFLEMVDQWPPGRFERELAEFREYWIERRDKRGGWDRTFHGQINRNHERIMRESHNGTRQISGGNSRPVDGFTSALRQASIGKTIDHDADYR